MKSFPKQRLLDVLQGDEGEIVQDTISDQGRWWTGHDLVFKLDGLLWSVSYRHGSTEMQDESPWEYDGDEIDCAQVHAVEVTTTVYRMGAGPVADTADGDS